jgi:hypothetical protein
MHQNSILIDFLRRIYLFIQVKISISPIDWHEKERVMNIQVSMEW